MDLYRPMTSLLTMVLYKAESKYGKMLLSLTGASVLRNMEKTNIW